MQPKSLIFNNLILVWMLVLRLISNLQKPFSWQRRLTKKWAIVKERLHTKMKPRSRFRRNKLQSKRAKWIQNRKSHSSMCWQQKCRLFAKICTKSKLRQRMFCSSLVIIHRLSAKTLIVILSENNRLNSKLNCNSNFWRSINSIIYNRHLLPNWKRCCFPRNLQNKTIEWKSKENSLKGPNK